MFEPTDETFLSYQQLQDTFGGNAVVMLVYQDTNLASAEGLQRNQSIANRVQQIEGVGGVLSLSVLNAAVEKIQPGQLLSTEPSLFQSENRIGAGFDDLFSGYTHSKDHSRASIVAMLKPDYSAETIDALEELARQVNTDEAGLPQVRGAALVGEPVLVERAFDAIERDGRRLATLTVALLSLVVVVALGDARFMLLSAVLIGWSVVVTEATMYWLGIHLTLVSTILTAIVSVIAVTTVLHLGVRFGRARGRGVEPPTATRSTLSWLLIPIVVTCATDAAGFAALHASRIVPIRQFGLMIATAAIAVIFATFFFAPLAMMLPRVSLGSIPSAWQHSPRRWLRSRCLRAAEFAIGRPRTVVTVTSVAALMGIVGMSRAETETSFLNNFRPSSPIVRAYADVESNLGGAGVWDVVLDAPQQLTAEYLDHVRALESDLRELRVDGERLTKVLSLADAELIASQGPLTKFLSPSSRLSGMYLVMPVFFDALLNQSPSGPRQLRIMLRSREQLESEQKSKLISSVKATVHQHVSQASWQESLGPSSATVQRADHSLETNRSETNPSGSRASGQVTGYYVLMSKLVNQLMGDQWRCFFASGCLVWVLLVLTTRSFRLATAAVVPNLLPIFVVLGLVGWMGGKLNMGAAMIAAVSIGLAIDGSVHFLYSYQRTRRRGHSPHRAATHAAGSIGVPVLLATLALVAGFGVMSTSEFVPTATFGTLIAVTLALGTLVNLTLLPSFVVMLDRGLVSRSRPA